MNIIFCFIPPLIPQKEKKRKEKKKKKKKVNCVEEMSVSQSVSTPEIILLAFVLWNW